jgi:1-hydroxycarotenoid 3,4-desaturase
LLVIGERAAGVRLADGSSLRADAVVVAADVAALAAGLLGAVARRAVPAPAGVERSLSAVTWAVTGRASGVPLVHHGVFFSDDYEAETRALWGERSVPPVPTIYCCAQDRATDAPPDGPERLLLLVNAPADGDRRTPTSREMDRWTQITFDRLAQMGLTIEPVEPPRPTSAADFASLYPATGGALYGPASHGWKSAFVRRGARTKLQRLYLAGGSVHPGAGVPMAMLSGRRAAEAISADLAWTSWSRRRDTPGTTSTSSATTGAGRSW